MVNRHSNLLPPEQAELPAVEIDKIYYLLNRQNFLLLKQIKSATS